ncbi:GNAT family N-acetyltransferase [Vibrio ulleungensis]|uniref:GNAT family N-acetyltransferase n=1 Tax=Vibrio ulleungensis TaxID=2807619 RepID=A0ABS2HBR7_9VIBR|nr:GNAT family N-acetyltransferase [Vibrio ulleungensis]MBM7035043.1 GNAT family N-acetyltransferase [Vibrio ulleungensis]
MITLSKLTQSDITPLKAVQLAPEQVKFAATAEEFLADTVDTTHLHVIKWQGDVVGFFKLDVAYAEYYEFCPSDGVGLRSFALDSRQQGKGIGTKSVVALISYLRSQYSHYRYVYLTVNCQNPAAISCYLNAGFEDTLELYHGGAAGPQHIMRKQL